MRAFSRVIDLVLAGDQAPVLDRSFPLEAIEDAMSCLADQEQVGERVLRV